MRLATSGHSYADNEVSISARAAQLGLLTPVTVLLSEKEPIVLAKRENIRFLPDGEDGQVLNEDDEMVDADAEDPMDDDVISRFLVFQLCVVQELFVLCK
ncbi:hypothetical protein BV898_19366 [Hypsibius exemplaris]|uniref:Uncharacterized protein n=1 Tax=Hypsibius exemplaris TaxID=2072580 RepID=A0A9X6RNV6_HYPEX|nr:hypothetical protein BV898_19366 [Hypsibius exemplaris]